MNRRHLIIALFVLSLGGGMLHFRIHPPFVALLPPATGKVFEFSHAAAVAISLLNVFVITALFLSKRTVVYGFLFKGMSVIFAIVLMGHFSIVDLSRKNPTLYDWVFKSTLADILIALTGFFIAKAIYDSYFPSRT